MAEGTVFKTLAVYVCIQIGSRDSYRNITVCCMMHNHVQCAYSEGGVADLIIAVGLCSNCCGVIIQWLWADFRRLYKCKKNARNKNAMLI